MTKKKLTSITGLCLVGVGTLFVAGCGSETRAEFDVTGVVAGIDPRQEILNVVHEDIPGYMPAMQMPFPVERPDLLEGLRTGDQINFHLTVTEATGLVTAIEKLPAYTGTLPAWELENLAGDIVSSSDFVGKVTIVNFWASWCQPCKVEMPILNQMTEDYPESDFAVVGIAQDPESRDAIAAVVEELDIRYPIVLTEGVLEVEVGGVPVIPGTMVVDKDGRVVDKRLGLADETELRELVESLL